MALGKSCSPPVLGAAACWEPGRDPPGQVLSSTYGTGRRETRALAVPAPWYLSQGALCQANAALVVTAEPCRDENGEVSIRPVRTEGKVVPRCKSGCEVCWM